jgi:Protein of unknown function (DUF2726)
LDICIFDQNRKAILAIEFDGNGHGNSESHKLRNELKEACLAKAGVHLIRIDGRDNKRVDFRQEIDLHILPVLRSIHETAA